MTDELATESAHQQPLPAGPLTLVVVSGVQVRRTNLPSRGLVRIGRDAKADIQLDDGQVSRFHAELQLDEHVRVRDLGSSNGTRLGGQRLPAHEAAQVLRGETIEVGNTVLLLHPTDEVPSIDVQALVARSQSSPMRRTRQLCDQAAATDRNVMLLGETGTGKTSLARLIHDRSKAKAEPFVVLDGAAFDRERIAQLFDDPTSSVRQGRGTLLLRQLGTFPFDLQQRICALADSETSGPSVRIMATSQEGPAGLVAAGLLRRELRFRVEQLVIAVPSLRTRSDELDDLFAEAIASACHQHGRETTPAIDPSLLSAVRSYRWPGNLRELQNRAEQAVVAWTRGPLTAEHMPLSHEPSPAPTDPDREERARIIAALSECAGNQSHAAKLLGISRRTLSSRLDKYQIPRPRKRSR